MPVTVTASQHTTVPAGILRGVLTAVEAVEGKFGQQVAFHWTVTTKGGEAKLMSWAPFREGVSPKSKIAAVVEALRGKPLDYKGGEQFDLELLVGHCALLVVKVESKADGSGDFNKITDVMPVGASDADKVFAEADGDDGYDPFGGNE